MLRPSFVAPTENLTGSFKKNQSRSTDGKSHRQFQKNQTQSADGKISPADSKIMRRRALTEKSHRQFQKKSESKLRRKNLTGSFK
jgi:hypothetical protein